MKIREDVNYLLELLRDKTKLKNSIKCTIVNHLMYIDKFIQTGPGVISPAKVEEKLGIILDLSNIWVKDSEFNEIFMNIKNTLMSEYLYPSISNKESIPETLEDEVHVPELNPRYIERLRPKNVERLDVSYLPIGPVSHYCLVYKVVGDVSFVIPFTTSGSDQFIGYDIEKSRFWRGKAAFTLHQFPTSMVLSKFVMPYDHKLEANMIIKSCEKYIRGLLPKERKKKKK